MQPSIFTTLSAGLVASMCLLGCAADGEGGGELEDFDVVLASNDGTKADVIDGKVLRVRTGVRVSPWHEYGDQVWTDKADLGLWKKVKVDLATDSTAVVSGDWFGFEGTDGVYALDESPWMDDGLLQLSVEKKAGSTARMGFLIQDVLWKRTPFVCSSGAVKLNYFESLTINLKAREVYANEKHTFTFAQCGIDGGIAHKALAGPDAGKPAWNFEVFVVPLETTGALKGTYEYRLKAEVI
jgi:hypothetical protein